MTLTSAFLRSVKPILSPIFKILYIVDLVIYHILVCVRNARKLFNILVKGTKLWVVMLGRLIAFTMILMPGWYRLVKYWVFSPLIIRNLEYGKGQKNRNTLDIYLPMPYNPITGQRKVREPSSGAPVVIFVSGGAWTIGYKMWSALVARGLSYLGIVTVVPDYRNFPQGDIEDMMTDVRLAVEWTLYNAPSFGGDPSKLVLAGQSAGSHICLCLLVKDYLRRKEMQRTKTLMKLMRDENNVGNENLVLSPKQQQVPAQAQQQQQSASHLLHLTPLQRIQDNFHSGHFSSSTSTSSLSSQSPFTSRQDLNNNNNSKNDRVSSNNNNRKGVHVVTNTVTGTSHVTQHHSSTTYQRNISDNSIDISVSNNNDNNINNNEYVRIMTSNQSSVEQFDDWLRYSTSTENLNIHDHAISISNSKSDSNIYDSSVAVDGDASNNNNNIDNINDNNNSNQSDSKKKRNSKKDRNNNNNNKNKSNKSENKVVGIYKDINGINYCSNNITTTINSNNNSTSNLLASPKKPNTNDNVDNTSDNTRKQELTVPIMAPLSPNRNANKSSNKNKNNKANNKVDELVNVDDNVNKDIGGNTDVSQLLSPNNKSNKKPLNNINNNNKSPTKSSQKRHSFDATTKNKNTNNAAMDIHFALDEDSMKEIVELEEFINKHHDDGGDIGGDNNINNSISSNIGSSSKKKTPRSVKKQQHINKSNSDIKVDNNNDNTAIAAQEDTTNILYTTSTQDDEDDNDDENTTASSSLDSDEFDVLSHLKLFIGVSGPYNLLGLVTHLHNRGLDSSIINWICKGNIARYSPSVQLALHVKNKKKQEQQQQQQQQYQRQEDHSSVPRMPQVINKPVSINTSSTTTTTAATTVIPTATVVHNEHQPYQHQQQHHTASTMTSNLTSPLFTELDYDDDIINNNNNNNSYNNNVQNNDIMMKSTQHIYVNNNNSYITKNESSSSLISSSYSVISSTAKTVATATATTPTNRTRSLSLVVTDINTFFMNYLPKIHGFFNTTTTATGKGSTNSIVNDGILTEEESKYSTIFTPKKSWRLSQNMRELSATSYASNSNNHSNNNNNNKLQSTHYTPKSYILKDFIPVALIHGSQDVSIPMSICEDLFHTLANNGADVTMKVYEGWSHTDAILEAPLSGSMRLFIDMVNAIHLSTNPTGGSHSVSIANDLHNMDKLLLNNSSSDISSNNNNNNNNFESSSAFHIIKEENTWSHSDGMFSTINTIQAKYQDHNNRGLEKLVPKILVHIAKKINPF